MALCFLPLLQEAAVVEAPSRLAALETAPDSAMIPTLACPLQPKPDSTHHLLLLVLVLLILPLAYIIHPSSLSLPRPSSHSLIQAAPKHLFV